MIEVSVVMPIYNEHSHLADCLQSLLKQTYPLEKMEWLFIDGGSTDDSIHILEDFRKQYPTLIKIYHNPQKTVPYAMNIGIKNAQGKYMVRLDAHSSYADDYIEKCILYLKKTGAENVGGIIETKGKGFVGETIAKMLSSPFGVGNSRFRTGGKDGYVDTVPFGAFPLELFQKIGGYDTRLTRNQDNEMNFRIRKNGGKIYLTKDIRLTYYCRNSITSICHMAFKSGMWNIITLKLCPGTMRLRHFVPFFFVMSLIFGGILAIFFRTFFILILMELLIYLICSLIFSFKAQEKGFKEFLLLFILFPIFHIFYGLGSFWGICRLPNIHKKARSEDSMEG